MSKKELIINIEVINDRNQLLDQINCLIDQASDAAQRAYARYSDFKVGAAVLLANGAIITGNNQENAAYPSGLCAERVALFYANANYPDIPVTDLVVLAYKNNNLTEAPVTPCGSCRQVLLESEMRYDTSITIFMVGESGIYKVSSAKDLLPLSFTGEHL
ncbi:cytidine deaminase [Marinilabiliaceae bacterium JC017]|nr:cytidine deaminase [Marinilabiliaceae bacterium JC017]